MAQHTIYIENLKCHGCAKTIEKSLTAIEGISGVTVIHDDSSVIIDHSGRVGLIEEAEDKLSQLGYPPAGKNSTGQKIISYISCARGRFGKEKE